MCTDLGKAAAARQTRTDQGLMLDQKLRTDVAKNAASQAYDDCEGSETARYIFPVTTGSFLLLFFILFRGTRDAILKPIKSIWREMNPPQLGRLEKEYRALDLRWIRPFESRRACPRFPMWIPWSWQQRLPWP
jgi:hypothetical protein